MGECLSADKNLQIHNNDSSPNQKDTTDINEEPVEENKNECLLDEQLKRNSQSTKQMSSKFDLQFDLVPVLYCLLNCPALIETFNQIQQKTGKNVNSIIDEIASLFKTHNTKKLSSKTVKSIESKLKSSAELKLSGTIRNESTAAELMEHVFSMMMQSTNNSTKNIYDSFCILSVPIPRSTVKMIVTVIHMQLHSDPSNYNNTRELAVYGFVNTHKTTHMPLEIYQIILNYVGSTFIPAKRYLLTLPSDARIIDIKLALQKQTHIPIDEYVFSEYEGSYPVNKYSEVHSVGARMMNKTSDNSEGFDKYSDYHRSDPTVWGLPNGEMNIVCYIRPSTQSMRKMFRTSQFRQVTVFHVSDSGGYQRSGIGFYITIPKRYPLPVSYIIDSINAMIKPYLVGEYDNDALPYTLKLHHRCHYRRPYDDCMYEQTSGCRGCDLKQYMNENQVINPHNWRLRCFAIHWKKSETLLFHHELFTNPMKMFDDISSVVESKHLRKYGSRNELSMIEQQNEITLVDCIEAYLEQSEAKEKELNLPKILVVKMQRFARNSDFRFKYRNKERVVVPFDGLDLTKYGNGNGHGDCKYDLFGILKCPKPGWNEKKVDKYETFFKDFNNNSWYKVNKELDNIQNRNVAIKHTEKTSTTEYCDILCYVRVD